MISKKSLQLIFGILILGLYSVGCNTPEFAPTPIPPTNILVEILPTSTPTVISPTPTVTATSTPIPPTPTATSTPTATVTSTLIPPTPTPLIPKTFEDVPEVEAALIQNLGSDEILNRFNIPELIPGPGVVEGGIIFSEGTEEGSTTVSTEFLGDILTTGAFGLGFTLDEPLELTGDIILESDTFNVKIHRFRNRVSTTLGYVFIGEGDDLNLLTFVRLSDVGYVYLRGKGQVILPTGEVVKLGYSK